MPHNTHLLPLSGPPGEAACGEVVPEEHLTPEINHVTCVMCMAAHELALTEAEDRSPLVQAYAVRFRGEVLVETVQRHPRGAMVNWLYANGFRVQNSATDDQIRQLFLALAAEAVNVGTTAEVVELNCSVHSVVDVATAQLAPPGT